MSDIIIHLQVLLLLLKIARIVDFGWNLILLPTIFFISTEIAINIIAIVMAVIFTTIDYIKRRL